MDAPVVMKFGGTSIGDADAIRRMRRIVEGERRPRLVVVSALSGVTDQLFALAATAGRAETDTADAEVEALRHRHHELTAQVVRPSVRARVADEIDATCDALASLIHAVGVLRELTPRSADAIVAFGERLSSRLVAGALASTAAGSTWIDATDVLVTNATHGRAQPQIDATAGRLRPIAIPALDAGAVGVVGGYVGATPDRVTTTLGRGGSDYSAAVFAVALDAVELQIWTDVDGMLTADPRIVSTARLVPQLSYAEASELAYFGANVLHPESIQPAIGRDLAVRILNARRPEGSGTTITATPLARSGSVTALACKRGITVIEITSARMLMAHGFLKRLFDVFDRFGTAVDVVTTSEVNVSVTIDDARRLEAVAAELSTFASVATEPDMALLCVVGDRLRDDATMLGAVVGALAGLHCRMVSQSANRRNLTLVIAERDLADAMTRLHDHFFGHSHAATA